MKLTELGIVIAVRLIQSLKALRLMVVTESGIVTELSAWGLLMIVEPSLSVRIPLNEEYLVLLPETLKDVKDTQPLNAVSVFILLTLSGMYTETKDLQFIKHSSGIVRTESGIVIDFKDSHP